MCRRKSCWRKRWWLQLLCSRVVLTADAGEGEGTTSGEGRGKCLQDVSQRTTETNFTHLSTLFHRHPCPFSFSNGINYAKNCCLFLSVLALAAYFMAHLPTSHFIVGRKKFIIHFSAVFSFRCHVRAFIYALFRERKIFNLSFRFW